MGSAPAFRRTKRGKPVGCKVSCSYAVAVAPEPPVRGVSITRQVRPGSARYSCRAAGVIGAEV